MSFMDTLLEMTAQALTASLTEEQRQRGVALMVAKSARPETDAIDQIQLANYLVTGSAVLPEPQEDPYPHASGDATVLGPQIFASTSEPRGNTVINWKGANFVPQPDPGGYTTEIGGQILTEPQWEALQPYIEGRIGAALVDAGVVAEHPDDPGPTAPAEEIEEPSGDLPEIDPLTEPAPMAGTHWQGRRGPQRG